MRGECKAKQAGFQMKNYREVPSCKFPINPYIPIPSPFCKGGLRGIFLIQPGFSENLQNFIENLRINIIRTLNFWPYSNILPSVSAGMNEAH
ncbi:hypothetical protein ES703_75843 [subsurface metagenome]